jgi:hypothetical protein
MQWGTEEQKRKYTNLRHLTRRLRGLPPGAEDSIMELYASELNLRIGLFVMELMGPWSRVEYRAPRAIDGGRWSYRMLSARGCKQIGRTVSK